MGRIWLSKRYMTVYNTQCCGSRSGSAWIHIDIGWLDPDPGEQKMATKNTKNEEMSCFEVLGVLF
jgi:hypothetical protein